VVKRRTEGRRVSRKLQEVQAELRRRMHTPVQSQHRWLCSVLRGHADTPLDACIPLGSTLKTRAR